MKANNVLLKRLSGNAESAVDRQTLQCCGKTDDS